ncbi:hypothetical protein NMG60_11036679 [Bertholletia excelsa]
MKKKAKKVKVKEDISEDWCFICKDGGLINVCDFKNCPKSYHAECVEKEGSICKERTISKDGNRWSCNWHYCFICHKSSKYHCYCCPNAVCQRCIDGAEFALVKGKKGFCNNCLKLALLGEEGLDVDSDGEQVDFKDRETYEGLFKEYWDIIKEQEGLTLEHLHSADVRLQKGQNYKAGSCQDKSDDDEDYKRITNDDDDDSSDEDDGVVDINKHKLEPKKKKFKRQREVKSNKREFNGWGSKSLMDFLTSVGEDTSKKLSQHDVCFIINGYIKENKLYNPGKKKILCDEKLKSLFGRKNFKRNEIYDLLDPHFLENVAPLEEAELESSEDDENVLASLKKRKGSSTGRKTQEKEVVSPSTSQGKFASIVTENIKLVYLKRTLVQELLKQPEAFEEKIVGSFVRVKSDSSSRRNSHQLVQVTGLKKTSEEADNIAILLQVADMEKDIAINMLSDDNFTEEECEDLRQKVKDGQVRKPTIVEIEEKARILHEDITKHWIPRELSLLQNLIDRANEKGWRSKLYEYMEKKRLLQTESEVSRLLQRVPQVISDVAEAEHKDVSTEHKGGDEGLPNSLLLGSLKSSGHNSGGGRKSSAL